MAKVGVAPPVQHHHPKKTLTHVGENRCRPAAGKVTPVHSLHNHIEYDTKLMVYQLLRGITENRIKQK